VYGKIPFWYPNIRTQIRKVNRKGKVLIRTPTQILFPEQVLESLQKKTFEYQKHCTATSTTLRMRAPYANALRFSFQFPIRLQEITCTTRTYIQCQPVKAPSLWHSMNFEKENSKNWWKTEENLILSFCDQVGPASDNKTCFNNFKSSSTRLHLLLRWSFGL